MNQCPSEVDLPVDNSPVIHAKLYQEIGYSARVCARVYVVIEGCRSHVLPHGLEYLLNGSSDGMMFLTPMSFLLCCVELAHPTSVREGYVYAAASGTR